MKGKSKKKTITSFLLENLESPYIDIEALKSFNFQDEKDADSSLKSALKNIKRRKQFRNDPKLTENYSLVIKKFLKSKSVRDYFKKKEIENKIIEEEQERSLYHLNVRRKFYQEQNDSYSNSEIEDNNAEVENNELSSFITDSSYNPSEYGNYGEKFVFKNFVLNMNEIDFLKTNHDVGYYDPSLALEERLCISSINYNNNLPSELDLETVALNSHELQMIQNWKMTMMKNKLYFPPTVTKPSELSLSLLLSYTNQTILNYKKNERYLNAKNQPEIDFICSSVSILFMYLFPCDESISFILNKPSITNTNTSNSKRVITDALILHEGVEIGCGEIKPYGTNDLLLEEDRARIAETMKRQLHLRIKNARSIREFKTFSVFVFGGEIELFMMTFDKNNGYQLYLVQNVTLPTTINTFGTLDISISFLLGFKNLILSSLPNKDDIEKPIIFDEYKDHLKPTLSFTKNT